MLDPREERTSAVRSILRNATVERMRGTREASGRSSSPIAPTNVKTLKPVLLPLTNPYPNNPEFSPTLTMLNSSPTSTHTAATTSEGKYLKHSSGMEPTLQQMTGSFSSLDQSNPGSYFRSHRRRHYDENSVLTFLEPDEVSAVPRPLPLPPHESRGPTPDVEAGGYNTPRDTFAQIQPSRTVTKAFTVHGLSSASLRERWAKRQEEVAREAEVSLANFPTDASHPQNGLLGPITAHEREREREDDLGVVLTQRERERRMVEERQRKFDELQKQQLEMVQNGQMRSLAPVDTAMTTIPESGMFPAPPSPSRAAR